ncbi:tRNA (adenosine(37)-N6)-dimethylallyltransferase MiaA [Mucilaginibacter sp. FT3.2]|uniref:tRNA (adenosine(37)-N6)-dimethylallyltransferase MiaA n=1 Tax=Mucilaginibacter sp. FT3.2 TaxID=2723090 RepID=UPI00160A18F2|nr:tRNA (adenosine(37)-N6)-dimethylallyltransferase MiaA [Mucilaginibacter sp. FT3.2]MBB6230142.1 tRNA dimethylallyltransferase [Mucilaginibacter sp. FT3.2]
MSPPNKTLIVIAGPTAIGKTAAAIEVAKHFNTVVVSADSRQFFREMSIGTAKPSADELAQVKHYFIDSHGVTEPFSVGDFEKQGLVLLDELFKTHDHVILAGGSGLYIKAICEGFDDLPTADPSIREKLNQKLEEKGIAHLQEKLKQADPVYYHEVDLGNPQRIIRALEVFESSGLPISSYRQATVNKRPFRIVKLALNMPRELLYKRINLRVDMMLQQGLLAEAESLLPYRHLNALNTVGYSEIFDYLDGNTTLDKAVEMIKQNTRRFAKRQLTWFRKDQSFIWLDAGTPGLVAKMVEAVESPLR